jgi:membrane protein DedA with SNARE-associated domain
MVEFLGPFITDHIAQFGYAGIVLLMGLESANIPIPSEVTLTFAGFLVSQGKLNLHLAAFAGALGCLLGSIPSYWIGKRLGRAVVDKYGKWFLLGPRQVALGDRWMSKYGNSTAFFSRLLPVVRTFISFIAGIWKAPFWTFVLLTFIGSLIWSYALVYVGYVLGENWNVLRPIWEKFDIAIIALVLGALVGYAWYHVKQNKK